MSISKAIAAHEKRHNASKQNGICVLCGESILHGEAVEGMRDGVAHDDCYYDALGEEIEKYPITSPRVRRG